MNRWIVYQRERFPIAGHGPLVAAFSASAVCFSSLVRGRVAVPAIDALVVAFSTSFLFFLQLRIADEFKDYEDDSRFRPYRPVPRGLVTLRELAWVALSGAVVQLLLALWLAPSIVWLEDRCSFFTRLSRVPESFVTHVTRRLERARAADGEAGPEQASARRWVPAAVRVRLARC